MPKQVDHDERRREIAEALWRLTLQEGIGAVSFRKVAAEAGVSVRRIQYYFGTKSQLLADSLQLLGELVVERGTRAFEALGPDPSPRAMLRAMFESALPHDVGSRDTSAAWWTFYVNAITDPDLRSREALDAPAWVIPFAADLIGRAADDGRVRPGVDPDLEARLLMSAFYGLSIAVLAGTMSPAGASEAIDYRLDQIFA